MFKFITFSALLAVASAGLLRYVPAPLSVYPYSQHQYHSQDVLGQYAYGYSGPLSAKQELKTIDGVTRGSYSYIDSNGILQTVDYTAGQDGFRVVATNLPKEVEAQKIPQQVLDTPEVAAAKSAHLAAVEQAKFQNYVVVPGPFVSLPQQVQDTPEVTAAKLTHFAAVEQAKLQNTIPVSAPIFGFPQQVLDTPEVAAAKLTHFAAVEQAKLQNSIPVAAPIFGLPQQVQDTPEVAAAKSAHLAAFEQAKWQNNIPNELFIELPRPVEDTPEVAQAKIEHLKAVERENFKNLAIKQIEATNGQVFINNSPYLTPLTYSSNILPSGYSYSYTYV